MQLRIFPDRSKVSPLEDRLVVPGRYTALSNDKKMVTILHRELERKVEKVKHMKLEVMRPKMNFLLNKP